MTVRPRIAFVVNGGEESPMGRRAAAFASRLGDEFEIASLYRHGGKTTATGRLLRDLFAAKPDLSYVLDVAAAGVVAAGIHHYMTAVPVVVDTGDAVVELGRVLGRGPIKSALTRGLERFAFRTATTIVVRGSYHQELLAERGLRAEFVPDGVALDAFATRRDDVSPADGTRNAVAPLTIGLVGSSVWIRSRGTCYGWELVELIRDLKHRLPREVRGIMIGGGPGIDVLKRRAKEYGIDDRIDFAGWIPPDELPERLSTIDICLSTQTNDVIGNVRTTGKLPLYLAAGRFVLASRVGEAARVLPDEMLLPFDGEHDPTYPRKLADRVVELAARGNQFSPRADVVEIARKHFDYDLLAVRLAGIFRRNLRAAARSSAD